MGFKTLAVVNPNSANGSTKKEWPRIADQIGKHVKDFQYAFTTGQGHATALARQGLKEGFGMIIAVGGDGTNNEVVNGFFEGEDPVNPDAVFSYITRGTGGDFRKTLRTPKEIEKAAGLLSGTSTQQIDVGQMTLIDHHDKLVSRYFVNIASFGISGEVDRRVNNTTKLFGGFVSFAYASLMSMLTYSNKPIQLSIDGKKVGDMKVFNCAVANGQYFGGGMQVAPHAQMDDGRFDVVVLGDFSLIETLLHMGKIYKGEHIHHPKVQSFTGEQVEATSDQVVLLDVDGEQPGRLPSTFRIRPKALRVKTFDP